jgi:cytochrome c oxidase cbb3-type subunit 2
MPRYPWFDEASVEGAGMQKRMRAMRLLQVPYTDADIEAAPASVEGKTELDAMVAYLQVLGTMISFREGRDYRE